MAVGSTNLFINELIIIHSVIVSLLENNGIK